MNTVYTIVQHSAYGYKGNPQFEKAVEVTGLTTRGEAHLVVRVGGITFSDFRAAEDFAEHANYPEPEKQGIIPAVQGTFSKKMINGLRIYVPVRNAVG